ncbi:MAG: sigma 54-interacting transcriptional regulator [Myxococcales bacterium]|nr:sigma 54-interacting transcriptional regulator [Myxococcales bacterium]
MAGPRVETVTLVRDDDGRAAGETAQLIVALAADQPRAASSRHLLDDVDQVELGRGAVRDVERRTSGGRRRLTVRLADAAASEQHARLTRVHGAWIVEDLGAKNRTFVNGRAVSRATVADGDVLEIGRTLVLFRDGAVPVAGAPDLRVEQLAPGLPGLPTFAGELATQLAAAATAARAGIAVLVRGPTGTGKELVARAIHAASQRRGAFVAVNCGALPANLVEAELFGHKKGAFSGAVDDRPGHVRSADKGTLLLDEIGDLPAPAQAALLRVLQEREVVPVGESLPVKVDVRVIAATHVDLGAQVTAGRFRRDLLARLAGLELSLPSLAERREDLGLLVGAILARHGGADARFTLAAARALFQHDWPSNVRELDMALVTALALAGAGPIDLPHLPRAVRDATQLAPPAPRGPTPESDADAALRAQLVALLGEHAGNISAVARATGKARWQVHRWLRRLGLDSEAYRR